MSIERTLLAVPARGGSKRLERKNLANLAGSPLITYTIEAALSSGLSDEVWVCTEDEEIAEVARCSGALVYSIPQDMAGDEVSSTVPCLALAAHLQLSEESFLVNLQPSSPLRLAQDVVRSVEALRDSGNESCVSVTPIDPHYFHWALVEDRFGWRMHFGDEFLRERTTLPMAMRPNGAVKAARYASVRNLGHFFSSSLSVVEMPEERSIHVATAFDLECAATYLRMRKGSSPE